MIQNKEDELLNGLRGSKTNQQGSTHQRGKRREVKSSEEEEEEEPGQQKPWLHLPAVCTDVWVNMLHHHGSITKDSRSRWSLPITIVMETGRPFDV